MRLQPIDTPPTLKARVVGLYIKRLFGKVFLPARVVWTRVPASVDLFIELGKLMDQKLKLDPELAFLLKTHVATLNDCAFCIDIAKAHAVMRDRPMDKLPHLADHATHTIFSERERAALAYVEEITRYKRVADQTFERLRQNFTESEIVEITLINAIENFYNLVNIPLQIESDGLCALVQARK